MGAQDLPLQEFLSEDMIDLFLLLSEPNQDSLQTSVEMPMPNIGYAFKGYDLARGNPSNTIGLPLDPGFRSQIFAPVLGNKRTPDKRYPIHEGTEVINCKGSCSIDFSAKTIKTTYDYQKSLEAKVTVTGSYGLASFSASVDYQTVNTKTGSTKSIFT